MKSHDPVGRGFSLFILLNKSFAHISALTVLCFSMLWAIPGNGQSNDPEIAAQISFGRVMSGQQVEQVITFSNPTTQHLEIANIQLSPPLIAKEIRAVIPPGENGQFTLVLGEKRELGIYEGLVRINFKGDLVDPVLFGVEGFVVPPIEFKPYAAFFVATYSGTQKTASIEIINHRVQPLLLTAAKSDSERFSTELETIETGQRYRLNLVLDGTAAPGRNKETIILLTDPPMEKPLRVQANTIIRESVYTFPETVDLGGLSLKVATDSVAVQTLSQTLMVYRPGTTDFEIETTVNLDFVRLESERGPDGDRYQLTLTLIPGKVVPGKIEGMVKIKTNDEKHEILEIPVSGYILD